MLAVVSILYFVPIVVNNKINIAANEFRFIQIQNQNLIFYEKTPILSGCLKSQNYSKVYIQITLEMIFCVIVQVVIFLLNALNFITDLRIWITTQRLQRLL